MIHRVILDRGVEQQMEIRDYERMEDAQQRIAELQKEYGCGVKDFIDDEGVYNFVLQPSPKPAEPPPARTKPARTKRKTAGKS